MDADVNADVSANTASADVEWASASASALTLAFYALLPPFRRNKILFE